MKIWVVAAVVAGVLLLAGLPALALTLPSKDDASPPDATAHTACRHEHGPPPWAQGHRERQGAKSKPGPGPGSAWRQLTPEQKAQTMTRLAREHAEAMRRFADCVAAGKDDCTRPSPPGLAKRSLR